jgi:hypothetical protein
VSAPEKGDPGRDQSEAERRRRRAEVFGDVLPESTSDDLEPERPGDAATDDWLRRNVPPHHG